ncbi:RNA-directed DNA polymerase, eukaryota, reverse transcriptase zinc-binding domain protein, partial [Tanacetum coccineum]
TEGSEKWQYTIYGYFVGCKMHVNELRYNTKRMWGRYGLKDIVVDADNMCFFKFKEEGGMNYIIEQSPWIVNEKPLVVQKWNPETSIKGISAISSRLRRHMMMDKITFEMCKARSRRLGFARVLVEVDATKEFLDKIKINYVDGQKKVKMSKWVKVEYSWKPDRCSHAKCLDIMSTIVRLNLLLILNLMLMLSSQQLRILIIWMVMGKDLWKP